MTPEKVTLGIDTAGGVAAAALTSDAHGVSTTDSQALEGLLPCVRRALASIDRELSAVSAIAVCIGPGSFTGLRIGVAFAKSLAQALGVAAVGISSFDIVTSVRAAIEGAPPRVAVVQGKRGFYYARIATPIDTPPIAVAGDRGVLIDAAREALGTQAGESELAGALAAVDCGPDVRAVAAARLGRAALDAGASGDWRCLAIEYGQRPNAVVNWELRHGPA
ncbi:MAG TPA: tRNA (adenosine(37)-N6)-threonylcarbamoyltransferase complex dimerization subunit type 1 TsaB [Candidatus Eremiobacteraceae bacterium]